MASARCVLAGADVERLLRLQVVPENACQLPRHAPAPDRPLDIVAQAGAAGVSRSYLPNTFENLAFAATGANVEYCADPRQYRSKDARSTGRRAC
jgi:hypothetical protein